MRATRLGRIAADAQILLLRRQATVTVRRAIYGVVGGLFGIGAIVLLHVLFYMALIQYAHLSPFIGTLIVLVVDAVIAGVFLALASCKAEDPLVAEARTVRDESLQQLRDTLATAAVLRPAGRYLGRKHIYGLVLAALTARFLSGRSR